MSSCAVMNQYLIATDRRMAIRPLQCDWVGTRSCTSKVAVTRNPKILSQHAWCWQTLQPALLLMLSCMHWLVCFCQMCRISPADDALSRPGRTKLMPIVVRCVYQPRRCHHCDVRHLPWWRLVRRHANCTQDWQAIGTNQTVGHGDNLRSRVDLFCI